MADRYFDLSIRLENAGMQNDADIAKALREVADALAEDAEDARSNLTAGKEPIIDVNGQRVGFWKIVDGHRTTEGYR